ncbi:MAG: putative sulfate exporter family transporter [Streptosporangiales bacterium]|nr:putative sulfate exporter family transporter [Streptosporangiales bacterium]
MTAILHEPQQQPSSPPPPGPWGSRWSRAGIRSVEIAPGLGIAVAVAIMATAIGHNVPVVGSAVPGAVIGAVLAIVFRPGERFRAGLKWASSFVLQCSVVILGTQLSIGAAARAGLASLPVMIGTLAVCLLAAYVYGRMLGVVGDLRTLIGVGTGICGASAIAAVSPVIEAAGTDIGYAVSTIFLFNIAAVLAFPLLGHVLGMSQHSFGLFAGTAVNDTSSVVATAATYGGPASQYAIVVKLVRTLMIIPICVALAWITDRKKAAVPVPASAARAPATATATARRMSPRRALKLVPWFLIGFVVAALLNTGGLVPASAHGALSDVSLFLVAVALSAIGLSTDVRALRRAGAKPLLLGLMLWVTVSGASLGLQALTGTLR